MVGGIVIGIARGEGPTLLHVQGTEGERSTRCSIRCEERRRSDGETVEVSLGDQVWWQCGTVYLTASGGKQDVALPKIGYSH